MPSSYASVSRQPIAGELRLSGSGLVVCLRALFDTAGMYSHLGVDRNLSSAVHQRATIDNQRGIVADHGHLQRAE